MKRFSAKAFLSLALILTLLVSLCAPAFAAKVMVSPQNLTVDGKNIKCEKYNIDDRNYFKLRDLAELLNGTTSQFDVDYDAETNTMLVTTGVPYTHQNGTELKVGADNSAKAVASPQTLKINGEAASLTAYNIGDVNFFQLRELGKALGFYVHYDAKTDTAIVDAQDEDEDWETGDASKDNPRNADGIGETEVLVVSFGTSFNDNRVATIGAIEQAMEDAFPGYSVRRAFTADIIIDHVYKRDDEKIDNVKEALDRAVANGVKNLLVQPTHLMDGHEYNDLEKELAGYADSFDNIVLGDPILTDDADYDVVIKALRMATKKYDDGKTAICLMGHGTDAESNHVYADFQNKLIAAGYTNYFVGTVEAKPDVEDVLAKVKAGNYEKVVLRPLMIVAGDHANNDMAGDEEDSWKSIFEANGFEGKVECVLEGLGQLKSVRSLLVQHLQEKAAEALDEDYGTGDASKDNPRNQDNIGEKELLVVSFGTSFNDNRVATIGAIEQAMENAFPEYSVRRGFTANIIIDHVLRRDGEKIDDMKEALDRAVANGVKELVVQPTHLMHGFEYDDVVAELAKYSDLMEIKVAEPLLTSDEDFKIVMDAIVEATKQYDDGKTAICFMGHGTEHEYNFIYEKMQKLLTDSGHANYFIGTVEAEPTVEDVLAKVKAGKYEKVVLRPLMIVAGDHANNDMAGDEEDSWKSIFEANGFKGKVECVLEGLGQLPAVQNLLVEHARAVMSDAAEAAPTSRAMASKTDKRDPLAEAGMTAVTGDKLVDGTYAVKVMHNGMFAVAEDATLTVKNGKMTAVITMSSESQNWLYMGDAAALASAAGSDLIPLKNKTFTIPVEALDTEIVCCSYSKNRDAWYERALLFRADSLKEDAFATAPGTDPASLKLADGAYTVAVAFAGGSGKTSITSPAKLVVKNGKLTATIVFSSSKYDWVKLGGTKYNAVTTDPGSTFELPVTKLDTNLAITGHTTAMGGQEINYTLNFDSASIK